MVYFCIIFSQFIMLNLPAICKGINAVVGTCVHIKAPQCILAYLGCLYGLDKLGVTDVIFVHYKDSTKRLISEPS